MNRFDKITPEGTKDLLFAECEAQTKVMDQIRQVFEKGGYRQVMTPGFEFYDVFSANAYFPQESMYKLMDNKGRLLVARPDSTIPIARLMSTKLKGCELPVRFSYNQRVYRQNPGLQGMQDEIMQMGVELIGDSSLESDLEVIMTGAEALSACQGGDYRIELGHVGIFKFLMDALDADESEKARIHSLISEKNYAALADRLDRCDNVGAAAILRELPKLFGGEEIFARARTLFGAYSGKLVKMLDYLEQIFHTVKDQTFGEQVMVDLGLVHQADYYTSLIFRGYISSAGEPVLSGGRYDSLLKDFGEDLPATGFGINIDQLAADRLSKERGQVTVSKTDRPIRIALAKGKLEKETVKLFEEVGFDCAEIRDKGRKLFLPIPGQNIDVVLAKAADVITYVERGVCDMGVLGKDTIMENGGTFYEVLNLGFGKCRFALAAPKDSDFYGGNYGTKTIASKYPNVTRSFFEEKGMDVDVIKIEGSVELAPLLGLSDAIVDIVETGTTLKENGLEVLEDVKDISARLIVNVAAMKLRRAEIQKVLDQLESRLKEREQE